MLGYNQTIAPLRAQALKFGSTTLRRCGGGGGGGGGEQKEVKNSSLLNSFPVVVVFSSFSPCLYLLVSLSFSLFFCTYPRTTQNAAAQAGITPVSTQPETMECSGAYKGLNAHFPLALKSTDSVLPF